LNSVLYIDAWRRFGRPVGFFSVPKSRPPGLTSIGPGNPPNLNGGSHVGSGNGARIDSYHLELAGFRLFAFAEFSAGPTSTCKATKEIAQATCVRDGALSASAVTDTRYRHLTVYFTTDDASAVTTPEAQRAERFWADVEMVPVGEAQWFTDLAGRARAAVK
jgi:hypothetical protein